MARVILWVITLLRVALIPVFVVLAARAQAAAGAGIAYEHLRWWAFCVLVVMAVSDVVDGWMARTFDLATQVGAVVDAAADKLVQVTLVAFFALTEGPAYDAMPVWFWLLLVGRDAVLGGGMLLARARGVPLQVRHRAHGRATSVLVFVILAWLAAALPGGAVKPLVVGTAVVVAVSGWLYLWDGISQARVVLRARRAAG